MALERKYMKRENIISVTVGLQDCDQSDLYRNMCPPLFDISAGSSHMLVLLDW